MIANQIRQLFEYNDWAWRRVYVRVDEVDEGAYRAQRPIFFGSLHHLLVHCLTAESLWLSRCLGNSPGAVLNPDDYADFTAVVAGWTIVRDDWHNFLRGLEDEHLARLVAYYNTAGEPFTLPLVDIAQHVVNHATEHRSQITAVLHQLGLPNAPLDYILFCTQAG